MVPFVAVNKFVLFGGQISEPESGELLAGGLVRGMILGVIVSLTTPGAILRERADLKGVVFIRRREMFSIVLGEREGGRGVLCCAVLVGSVHPLKNCYYMRTATSSVTAMIR